MVVHVHCIFGSSKLEQDGRFEKSADEELKLFQGNVFIVSV